MWLDSIIQNGDFDESQKALDFCAFLLRYNWEIDYSFFSENPEIQESIWWAEMYRSWADIEDIANQ